MILKSMSEEIMQNLLPIQSDKNLQIFAKEKHQNDIPTFIK